MKKLIYKIALIVLLLGLVAGAYVGNIYYKNFVAANVTTEGKAPFLYIPRGATTEDVYHLMEELKVLKDQASFEWMAEKKNYTGRNIVAGKYKITDGMTNNALVNHLRAGNGRLDVAVTFNHTRDLRQLAGAMARELALDSTAILDWVSNEDSVAKFGFNKHTFISMFIPNTYRVDWAITTPALMRRMAKEYKQFWNADRKAKLQRCRLSQSEVVTLASIVYWETNLDEDKPKIAGVYMNRLRIGMPLQADPTLIFALGDYSIKRVLNKHKEIDSPYNTYKNRGLPPGPILVPPISYVDAVLDFEDHNYLYFVATENFDGRSYFAKTYQQHLVYARRYQRALNKRKIYR